jgi:hypothetical protein
LQCSVRLLDGNDEDLRAGLEVAPVSRHINDNGGIGRDHLEEYRQYRCSPSEAFAGLTFCLKIRFERDGHGSYNVMYSLPHTREGTLVYRDRYQRPGRGPRFGPRRSD